MPKYFGTDGIRGEANGSILRPDLVVRIGQAAAQVLGKRSPHIRPTVVIGKDTRLSGYMIESALQAGFTSAGFYCLILGPLPTPAVAMLTRSLRADLGVMITASHNPFEDNGIKLFSPNGVKVDEEIVAEIEHLIDHPEALKSAPSDKIGKAVRVDDAVGRYIEFCKTSVPRDFYLNGMRVVVDCAHGAAYKIAPKIFWELGAQVIRMGCAPDGFNINRNVGATSVDAMCKTVKQQGADLGIALDGDGDRLIMCDENGEIIDGDQILAGLALYMKENGCLKKDTAVSTVMANLGMQRFLEENGMTLVRTPVGDHHVAKAMRENDYNLGGESSGHLIFRDFATTGDGILAALQVLNYLRVRGKQASCLRKFYMPWPMTLENIRFDENVDAAAVLDLEAVQETVAQCEANMGDSGRVVLRKSGTEPLIRVMVEAETQELVDTHLKCICNAVNAAVSEMQSAA